MTAVMAFMFALCDGSRKRPRDSLSTVLLPLCEPDSDCDGFRDGRRQITASLLRFVDVATAQSM